ncbi:MAG: CCA-adding enzyme [candidate division WS6 bacterium OLB20]|uniref:CCA-adding enzyme n=1 Tax=candidate division WS6 bacterium OLB20 TaxID=1617426 RepID=A0A136LYC2_9BACT|nr:MAG: CCA-adding enzyme [candidate division WS6 bacterium OLB20]
MEDKQGERFEVEVTTYRKEEDYYGGRWPGKVEFSTALEEDLARRDFTVNAMAIDFADLFDASATTDEVIVDPFGGNADLAARIIRSVRDPLERLSEDGLRSYKACRLAAELGFEIEPRTFEAITETLHVADQISRERIRDELNKLLLHSPKPSTGIDLMRRSGLLGLFMPELLETIGVTQPEWHEDDVYTHSLKTLDLAPDSVRLAALLHDIGKPSTRSEDETGIHFYSHDVAGAAIAKEIMTRLRYSSREITRVSELIRWHMFYYPSADWRKEHGMEKLQDSDGGWTDSAVRRFIQRVGEDLLEDLFKLRIADATANPKSSFDPSEIRELEKRISQVRSQELVLKISDLSISGEDLKQMGISPGPVMGNILNRILDMVIEEPILNERDTLLKIASEMSRDMKTE